MLKNLLKVAIVSTMAISSANAAEITAPAGLGNIQQVASAKLTYLQAAAGTTWEAPSCPEAIFAIIDGSQDSYKELLALALTAKASEANIQLFGDCVAGTPGSQFYFAADQIIMN